MNAINIRLYNLFRNDLDLPDARAEDWVQALNEFTKSEVNNSMMEYRSIFKEDLLQLDNKIALTAADLRGDLRSEIKDSKVDTIKWMVGVFLALALMILGLYFRK